MIGFIRAVLVVGGALVGFGALEGCNRNQTSTPPDPNPNGGSSNPQSTYAPPYIPPYQPPPISPSINTQRPPDVAIPASPNVIFNCDRFSDSSSVDVYIRNPRFELDQLNRVIQRIESHHRNEASSGNFSNFRDDSELTNRLNRLAARDSYLQEGVPSILDTESDVMNLYTTRDWLIRVSDIQTYYPQSNRAPLIAAAWRNNTLEVALRRYFRFHDSEIPHLTTTQNPNEANLDRIRVIAPVNHTLFSVLQACGKTETDFVAFNYPGRY
ncbi:MAG: hypothetical protein JNK65_04935 [Deltaproteobacteria bacterium]|nr:hypothetical protein [Deltaproteobacteria bacterium]